MTGGLRSSARTASRPRASARRTNSAASDGTPGATLPSRLVLQRPPHVRALHAILGESGHGTSTTVGVHDLLVQILRWASRRGMPVYGPLLNGAVERPGETLRETRSISFAEALRLLEAMGHERPFGPLVKTMYYQGLRASEASALKWGDVGTDGIDAKRKRDRAEGAPKWASSGWVPMLPHTREAFDEHCRWCDANGYPTEPHDWVFGHRRAKASPILPPIHQTNWQHIKDACARAELSKDIAAHSLQRCFSDAARQAVVSVTELAEMLRNDPAVALRYQSKDPELRRRQARKISRAMRGPAMPRRR